MAQVIKVPTCNVEVLDLIPGLGRSPEEGIYYPLQYSWVSLVAQLVKNSPTMWETCIESLGWEDPLETGKSTHSVLWPGEFRGLYTHAVAQSWTQLSDFHFPSSVTNSLMQKIPCLGNA